MKTSVKVFNDSDEVIPKSLIFEICQVIEETKQKLQRYRTKEFRSALPIKLKEVGWSDNIYLHPSSRISITSMKGKTGLCIQMGNVSRIYADLIKLQTLYAKGIIVCGIIVLPMASEVKNFGDNCATMERLERELPIFNDVITLPLALIGIYEED